MDPLHVGRCGAKLSLLLRATVLSLVQELYKSSFLLQFQLKNES